MNKLYFLGGVRGGEEGRRVVRSEGGRNRRVVVKRGGGRNGWGVVKSGRGLEKTNDSWSVM